jgi:subtilisin family serine protease
MSSTLNYKDSLKSIVPLSLNGQSLFAHHTQIVNTLTLKLGKEYAELFALPYIPEGGDTATWSSNVVSNNYTPLTDLPEQQQEQYRWLLFRKLEKIEAFIEECEASSRPAEVKLGKILTLAISLPDEKYILTENGKVVFVAWGFKQKKVQSYSLIGFIRPTAPEKEFEQEEQEENLLPKEPRVIIPIEDDEIVEEPDTGRVVVGTRLNLALIGENRDLKLFAKAFKQTYPQKEYQIIYYDDLLHRIQIKIPQNKYQNIKETIKEKLSDFTLLVIPETIFTTNNGETTMRKSVSKMTWHLDIINANKAWGRTQGEKNVVVAVIDDGFDIHHPSFEGKITAPYNVVTRNDLLTPDSGHGTHVAGIAVGNKNLNSSAQGIAPKCSFMPIQVADEKGRISSTAVTDAILYAIYGKADVINISLGETISPRYQSLPLKEQESYVRELFKDDEKFWDQLFELAINENNISVVLAAGNDDLTIGMDPRVRSKHAIKVSAIDNSKTKAGFSNFGKFSTISSPGVSIYSSYPDGKYEYLDGTSMSAPIVAGAVALLKSAEPNIKANEVVERLQSSGIKPSYPVDRTIGNIVQLDTLLSMANSEKGGSNIIPPIPPTPNDDNSGGGSGYTGGGSGGGGNGGNMPPIPPDHRPSRWRGCLTWLVYALLFILFLLLCLFLFRKCTNNSADPFSSGGGSSVLPPPPVYVAPIDTAEIIQSPDSLGQIVGNRLNIAFKNENADVIERFAQAYKEKYPDKQYLITYYDTATRRIQIEMPTSEREDVKKMLKSEFPDYEMLIWEESLFKSNFIPNDPVLNDSKKSWYLKAIKAVEAWEYNMGDSSIVVAVIDNGFDLSHPELKGKIFKPYNPFTKSEDVSHNSPSTGDGFRHGTHVAGTAVARANNRIGIIGIAPNCKLMPIKVADEQGNMSSSAIVDGVLFAINQGADVINISLGTILNPSISQLPLNQQEMLADSLRVEEGEFWNELMEIAYSKNVVIVAAAGNEDMVARIDPMKRSDKIITVSAVNPNLKRAEFSNFGSKSTISAPGVQIYSSTPNNNYEYLNGTSMASPVVAGAVALIKSLHPAMGVDEIIEILQSTGIPIDAGEKKIGNLIQLAGVLKKVGKKRRQQPVVPCDDVQAKIDSLLYEIEKLKNSCEIEADTLKIPNETKDLSSSRWKSTTDIYDTGTEEKVELYFDLEDDGSGEINILYENSGIVCTAPLEVSVANSVLHIKQLNEALCDDGKKHGPYIFKCEQGKNGEAICKAQNQKIKDNQLTFKLVSVSKKIPF